MTSQITNPVFGVESFEEDAILDSDIQLAEFNRQYTAMMVEYEEALEQVITQLLNAKRVLEKVSGSTMIRSLSSRLKSTHSILEKLERLDFPLSLPSMKEHLFDIAGIRVICSYIDDIYTLKNWLTYNSELRMVMIKDYIKKPKPSGYRSLHMIVQVLHQKSGKWINVEIQLRTTAMDSWAALEHQMRYKKDLDISEEISKELYACAATLYDSDLRMQNIHRKLSKPTGYKDNSIQDFKAVFPDS